MTLKYNYVLFSTQDGPTWRTYPDGYNTICAEDLNNNEGTKAISAPLDYCNPLVRLIFSAHCSPALAQKIKLPFKEFWYPYYFKNDFREKKPLCFLLLNLHLPPSYLDYLKKKYPDCKIVLLHRDLLKICQRISPWLLTNKNIDLEMTFDKGEAAKYGFPHFNEFESKINLSLTKTPECDVYFAGKAKDRLSILLDVFERLTSFGLNCKYYLTGVPSEQRVEMPGIKYADKFMTYREMVTHTVNANYVLEINQGGADGYTSRFLEAVMYNKKLITNNAFIRQSEFYDPDKILIIEKAEDIRESFFESGPIVDYHYNGEFSPMRMIERVEEELIKKYAN